MMAKMSKADISAKILKQIIIITPKAFQLTARVSPFHKPNMKQIEEAVQALARALDFGGHLGFF